MDAPTPPDITTENLGSLLEQVHDGRIQVPEFQRAIHSDDDGIRLLLASVSLNYSIGAVKLLRAGNPDLRFEALPIAGAPVSSIKPDRLLLDGQHRIAVLYQVLASGHAVSTHDEDQTPIQRWYYVDMNAALDPGTDRDEAIISLPENRQVESEWEQRMFPLRLVFGANGERVRWQRGFVSHGAVEDADARHQLMDRFETEVLAGIESYRVPTIIVDREWARWAVRVHGGRDGRSLSDRFRIADRDVRRR